MKEIYLNTAATGRIHSEYISKASKKYQKLTQNASTFAENWFDTELPKIKRLIENRFGALDGEVALVPNFSFGVNAVLNSLPENSNVLCYKKDYPSLIDPLHYKNFNVFEFEDVDGFKIYPETIERYIRKHYIDFLVLSHVQWLTGFESDLSSIAAICKRNNVRLIVDATQSAGVVPIDFDNMAVDVMLFSNYKWLNAGFGTGVLLMKKSFIQDFPPKISGMHSYEMIDGKPVLKPSVKCYEPGHQNLFGFEILKQVLEERSLKEIKGIRKRNQKLTTLFLEELPLNFDVIGNRSLQSRSSIVYLKADEKMHQFLTKNGVITSFRGGNVRFSFHFDNKKKEVNEAIDVLKKFKKKG